MPESRNLAICEIFNPELHGLSQFSSKNITTQFLVHTKILSNEFYNNNYKETFKGSLDTPFVSMHVNTNHLIKITGPDTARGRVYLLDGITKNSDGSDIEPGSSNFLWFALYDEEYVKIDGEWKIKNMNLEFFWPERHVSEGFSTDF